MNPESEIETLLRWRSARAETEAPPAPRAARLLELARPWWEIWPERFRALADRVSGISVALGHAMTDSQPARTGHPVATLVVRAIEELETSARVLYLNVRDGRLRLRFHLDTPPGHSEPAFEATFVAEATAEPLFTATAEVAVDHEYRIDVELPAELAVGWETLKVMDRMPFRLILCSMRDGA